MVSANWWGCFSLCRLKSCHIPARGRACDELDSQVAPCFVTLPLQLSALRCAPPPRTAHRSRSSHYAVQIRIDMSEYQEKHTVARLIGAPPGYGTKLRMPSLLSFSLSFPSSPCLCCPRVRCGARTLCRAATSIAAPPPPSTHPGIHPYRSTTRFAPRLTGIVRLQSVMTKAGS